MKKYLLVGALALSFLLPVQAGEEVVLNFSYSGSASDPDFTGLKGPLKIAAFVDQRVLENKRLLSANGTQVEAPVAEIISAAFVQAFSENAASPVTENERFTLEGSLTELSVTNKEGNTEVLIRAHVALKDGSRTIWESPLVSRASAATLPDATRNSINGLVKQLFLDDYFLMELI